jgi:hypothetical protein
MGAADKRIAELLERWLTSLELHGGYLDLDNEAYSRAQPWPQHQRPTRWIIDLARTRTLDLKRMLGERQARGDTDFAEALELMSFLTTLLGFEHVERFIPLAVAPKSGTGAQRPAPAPARAPEPAAKAATVAAAARPANEPLAARPAAPAPNVPSESSAAVKVAKVAPSPPAASSRVIASARATPAARAIPAARPAAPARVIPAANARNRSESAGRKSGSRAESGAAVRARVTPTARTQNTGTQRAAAPRNTQVTRSGDSSVARGTASKSGASGVRLSERVVSQVIADAVRMLDWGSEWPQLAGLIARMADRPAEKDVWRILREHRPTIESKAKAKARAG